MLYTFFHDGTCTLNSFAGPTKAIVGPGVLSASGRQPTTAPAIRRAGMRSASG